METGCVAVPFHSQMPMAVGEAAAETGVFVSTAGLTSLRIGVNDDVAAAVEDLDPDNPSRLILVRAPQLRLQSSEHMVWPSSVQGVAIRGAPRHGVGVVGHAAVTAPSRR